ncbi:MAG: ABC transporter permease [Chloroflexi bacterium]|nr:ABC transporter permease [Chloroflexota bacterium]
MFNLNPRWRKALRDLWVNKTRTILVILAIGIGIVGVGSILTSYSILTREMDRNFMETNPATAVFYLENIDDELIQTIQSRPDIAAAEARRTLFARYQMGDNDWINIMLFVIDDFDNLRVNTFTSERGGWNPAADEILIERSGEALIGQDVGEIAIVKTAGNAPQSLTISGIVHDPGQAPSWMEGYTYGYITLDGLEQLGESPSSRGQATFNELRVVMAENANDQAANRQTADSLREWLTTNGYSVTRLKVPVPGKHPHNSQMMTLLFILEAFGVLALLLSGLLVATMISALMEQQVRQIGVMKTFGARMSQIGGIYLATVIFLGVMALIIGIPAGLAAGRAYSAFAATTLNFEIASNSVDGWVYVVLVAAALLIPTIGAAFPIYKGSRITVREAISDNNASENGIGTRPIDALLGRVQGFGRRRTFGRALLLALRNTFRRQGRLALTLLALAVGGAVFMVALNVGASWNKTTEAEFAARRFDADVQLKRPYPSPTLQTLIADLPDIVAVETWADTKTSLIYADGSNGDLFRTISLPPTTPMIDFPLIEGRWLRPDDENALVVSHVLPVDHDPSITVGSELVMDVNGQVTTWTVVGIVRQVGQGVAYANQDYFAPLAGLEGQSNHIQIAGNDGSEAGQAAMLQTVEATLLDAGVDVTVANTSQDGRQVLVDHFYIIVTLLMLMAALVAAVSGLGLASTMSLNVLERRREIGVMRTVGATSMKVLQVILGEGVFIGLLSWGIAILLSVPMTAVIANVAGMTFIETPLDVAYSWSGAAWWLGIVMVLTAVASSLPAMTATEMPVNEVLAYE